VAGWEVDEATGPARAFHERPVPDPARRALWRFAVEQPVLVIGSAQATGTVDHEAAAWRGVEVVRRRSGGGAVLLVPGEALWIDIVVPRDDTLWHDDVGVAAHWLGDAWAAALGDLGVAATVHRGGLERTPWSSLVCFAGLGPGEVVDGAGRKLVGISQRRTRAGARFQCAALAHWDAAALVALLALRPDEREAARAGISGAAAPVGVDLDALAASLRQALPLH
jgi:lipoate-protein ligase A